MVAVQRGVAESLSLPRKVGAGQKQQVLDRLDAHRAQLLDSRLTHPAQAGERPQPRHFCSQGGRRCEQHSLGAVQHSALGLRRGKVCVVALAPLVSLAHKIFD